MLHVGLAILLGILVGLSLGALGGGGSILTVPALVYALGENPHEATAASLVIVGLTSAMGMIGHHRLDHVRWVSGVVFGVIGIVGAFAGTRLSRSVPSNLLLGLFALLMLVASVLMLLRSRHRPTAGAPAPASAGGASAGTARGRTPRGSTAGTGPAP
ncbi:MAG: TSUP family transporter, partial [Actinomycetes bacterium]